MTFRWIPVSLLTRRRLTLWSKVQQSSLPRGVAPTSWGMLSPHLAAQTSTILTPGWRTALRMRRIRSLQSLSGMGSKCQSCLCSLIWFSSDCICWDVLRHVKACWGMWWTLTWSLSLRSDTSKKSNGASRGMSSELSQASDWLILITLSEYLCLIG